MTNPQMLVAALITLAVAISSLRTLRRGTGRRRAQRGMLLVLQIAAATLLYLTLFPPGDERPKQELTVLTADAEMLDPQTWADDQWVAALPEAGLLTGPGSRITQVPDLAAALRAAPDVERLRVIGRGLPPRDQRIDPGIAIEFVAAPRRPGLVELDHPDRVAAGRPWSVRGRIEAMPGASVVLRDVADIEVARATGAPDGGFMLEAPGTPAGRLSYRLELLDSAGQRTESLAIPIVIEPGDPLRVALLSGAPNPELKYLRRWATDAGLAVESRIVLTRGTHLGTGPDRWDTINLAGYDLLMFDERAWAALAESERQAIGDAVQAGLGLMIRLTGQASPVLRAQLDGLGFAVEDAKITRGVRLADRGEFIADAIEPGQLPAETLRPVELARQPLSVSAVDGAALVRETGGQPLGLWRAVGRGRVGLLWLTDSYRMVLAGDGAGHGALWSELIGTLARGREQNRPIWQQLHRWPHHRAVVCGLAAPAHVLGPNQQPVQLIPDPVTVTEACAGFWPRQAGWHRLRHAGAEHAFFVHPVDAGAGLRAEQDRAAMIRLIAGRPGMTETNTATRPNPGPSRWLWFAGWLLSSGLLWWCERRPAPSS